MSHALAVPGSGPPFPPTSGGQPLITMNRLLRGRYRLIAELGVGGMGITYRAWDNDREVPIVVKMPRQEQTDEHSLRRFSREIETMVNLRHDHIVPILDHGEEDGIPFVVMRFLPGGSLADQRRVNPDGTVMPTPPGFLRFWLPAIADAIDFVHRHGVIHRDVKPRNIFFDGFWNAFLGDFGIAKVLNESGGMVQDQTLTAATFAMGTQEYMAPELFLKTKGEKETGQVDQYALAVSVYEMLAGVRPFTGSKGHLAVEHLQMKPPSLRKTALGLPPSLCMAIERALEKRPGDRFPTCAAFAAAAIQDVPPLAAEPGIARLLCPKCNMILRIPVTSGGRSGACPTCKSMMRIAPDFGALWLSTEDTADRDDTATEAASPFASEEDLVEVATAKPDSVAEPLMRRWRRISDSLLPYWLRDSEAVMPVIAAAATLGVTHSLWSVYHQGVVDTLNDRRVADTANLEQRLSKADADAEVLRNGSDTLRRGLAEMEKIVGAASFRDLNTLPPDMAQSLVRWKRGDLSLDGLTSLSDETAAVLAKHVGTLSLNGLTRLTSEEAANALSRHRGPVLLRGLLTISPAVRTILMNNGEIQLPPQKTAP